LQYRQKGGGAPPSAAWAPVQARRTSGRGRHAARLPVRETRPRKQGFRRDARAVRELRKVLGRKSNVRRPFLPRRSRRGERLQKARQTGWHSSTTVIRSSFCRTTRNAFRGARRLRTPPCFWDGHVRKPFLPRTRSHTGPRPGSARARRMTAASSRPCEGPSVGLKLPRAPDRVDIPKGRRGAFAGAR
jgi:hypothetical protein